MPKAPAIDVPMWIQDRIVAFFNAAQNVEMILDGTIMDDPADGPGRVFGPALAARILRTKNELPRRQFSSFEEIDAIRGVGPDVIQDLVYSFGKTADETFRNSMYETGTIYMENWPLEYFRFEIGDKDTFYELTHNREQLRQFIMEKVAQVSKERGVSAENTEAMLTDLKQAYIDDYSNSTPIASYALALYFYDFDADNWFSWDTIQKQTLGYFDHYMNTNNWSMELFQFRGFRNRGIIEPGIAPEVLPVVATEAELAISFWITALYD